MADATTIIDGVSVASGGGTEEGTFDVGRADQGVKVYVDGDANSTDLDVQLLAQPDELSKFYFVDGTERANKDLTTTPNDALVVEFDYRPADEIKVRLVNNAASATTVTVKVKKFKSI